MIRSESISSSWIEGVRENPGAIAIAQISHDAASHNASSVVRNVDATKAAIECLGAGDWTHEDVLDIHHDLLPWHRPGYRTGQVWIGGRNKFNADYAGPPHELVRPLMDDLLGYANTSGDLPVVKAAIIHAQFETIHPFEDGNGRVGRALVHGFLKRAGLVDGGVIPLSTVLPRRMEQFLDYVGAAVSAAERFRVAAIDIHHRWKQSFPVIGRTPPSTAPLLVPVSARFRTLGVSVSAHSAGIVRAATGKYRKSALFQADDILDLLEHGTELTPGGLAGR